MTKNTIISIDNQHFIASRIIAIVTDGRAICIHLDTGKEVVLNNVSNELFDKLVSDWKHAIS